MRIKEATKTVGGYPVRIYEVVVEGACPVHGAFWNDNLKCWQVTEWRRNGKHPFDDEKDLDLSDWRENIPWQNLDSIIVAIARQKNGEWRGFSELPQLNAQWLVGMQNGYKFHLNGFCVPNAPSNWSQTLAIRPGYEEK